MFIDTHVHLDFSQFDDDRDQIIKNLSTFGVDLVINVGCNLQSSQRSVDLAEKYDNIYATIGIHPHDADEITDKSSVDGWEKLLGHHKVVAIGEIGMDTVRSQTTRDQQIKAFEYQLDLAEKHSLPVIIHNRQASADVLSIIKNHPTLRGVFHCFSDTKDVAEQVLNIGFYISFTGNITYPGTDDLCEVVKLAPLDRLLLETDCPYMAPQTQRGLRNEPRYVATIAKQIADIKKISIEKIAEQTTTNAKKLFNRLTG